MTTIITKESDSLNEFARAIPPSPTLAMSEKAAFLKKAGHDVINLSVGEPDLLIPDWIQDAAIKAIGQGVHVYTPIAGLPELRQAVVNKLDKENGLRGYTSSDVIVSNGAKQVLFNAFMVSLNPGQEVIIPAPYWVSYPTMVSMAGGVSVMVTCDQDVHFKMTPDILRKAITPRTRWVILNSPSNPTGAVYSAQELQVLADVLRQFPDIWIMSDDIYEHLCYEPHTFTSILNVAPDLKERTLLVNGLSKSFSMTGWRIGYGIGPKTLIDGMIRLQSHSTSGANCIAQHAAIAALDARDKSSVFLKQQVEIFKKRRDIFVASLSHVMDLCVPEGAFYVYANVQKIIKFKGLENDMALGQKMLEEIFVSAVPGTEFGLPGYLRFSYALGEDTLRQACHRILCWVQE